MHTLLNTATRTARRTASYHISSSCLPANTSYQSIRCYSKQNSLGNKQKEPSLVAIPHVPSIPPKTWVDNLPPKVRPYLYLTRIDKPIGTLLLYYPCSELELSSFMRHLLISNSCLGSMVDHNGLVRSTHANKHTAHISKPVWRWGPRHAWGGMHNQRHVGPEARQGSR